MWIAVQEARCSTKEGIQIRLQGTSAEEESWLQLEGFEAAEDKTHRLFTNLRDALEKGAKVEASLGKKRVKGAEGVETEETFCETLRFGTTLAR